MTNPLFEAFEANRDLERHLNREWKRIRRERNMIPRWKKIYSCFALDIGLPPSLAHRIERIDETQRWCAENVRWRAPRLRE